MHILASLNCNTGKNTVQKTVVSKLTLFHRYHRPMHAFSHLLSEKWFGSPCAVNLPTNVIFQKSTSTQVLKQYRLRDAIHFNIYRNVSIDPVLINTAEEKESEALWYPRAQEAGWASPGNTEGCSKSQNSRSPSTALHCQRPGVQFTEM